MINGLGVFGWGVGGIEAEAVMLGQPMAMLIPDVVGFELTGKLPPGATATDLVLTVTQMLRKKGVVDKFVEFFGAGHRRAVAPRSRDDREHGAGVRRDDGLLPRRRRDARRTCASPAAPTITSSSSSATARRTILWHDPSAKLRFADTLSLDPRPVEPSLAGPARPQDRVPLKSSRRAWRKAVGGILGDKCGADAAAIDAWAARRPRRRAGHARDDQATSPPTRARSSSVTARS